MKIIVRNLEPIVIPDDLAAQSYETFTAETSYVPRVLRRVQGTKLASKLVCLEGLFARACQLGGYRDYSDPLAGVGLSARILGDNCRCWLNDTDADCRRVLDLNFEEEVEDIDVMTEPFYVGEATFLDFNNLTFRKLLTTHAPPVKRVIEGPGKFLMLNDCSVFYLRYGPVAHEVYSKLMDYPIHGVDDYFRALTIYYKTCGWHLVQASYFSESSFLLLSKEPGELVVDKVERGPRLEGVVRVE